MKFFAGAVQMQSQFVSQPALQPSPGSQSHQHLSHLSSLDFLLMCQTDCLLSLDSTARRDSAQLLLDMLSSHPDKPAFSEAMLRHQLHIVFIERGNRVDLVTQEIYLRILLKFVEQPALHGMLLADGIVDLLAKMFTGFLQSFPGEGSPKFVATMVQLLCADGATSA